MRVSFSLKNSSDGQLRRPITRVRRSNAVVLLLLRPSQSTVKYNERRRFNLISKLLAPGLNLSWDYPQMGAVSPPPPPLLPAPPRPAPLRASPRSRAAAGHSACPSHTYPPPALGLDPPPLFAHRTECSIAAGALVMWFCGDKGAMFEFVIYF
ncbi:hypothetical protein R5R35_009440 [Gryllus longicercus]|uniref:Uncharacterized protein n=1 Tax=Gryllus longicercus TaxID=2509291 RepID=A0AAN9YY75_9ORTH